jgi:hypothetical protein
MPMTQYCSRQNVPDIFRKRSKQITYFILIPMAQSSQVIKVSLRLEFTSRADPARYQVCVVDSSAWHVAGA